jgi:hypothetical protein
MQLTTSIIQDILTRSSTNHNRSKEKTLNYCIKAIAVPNKELVLSTDSVAEGGFIKKNKKTGNLRLSNSPRLISKAQVLNQ